MEEVKSICVPANSEELENVWGFISEELEHHDCPMRASMQLEMAVEEIFVNISSYAYKPVEGEAEIKVAIQEEPLSVIIQFLDAGKPFNPLAKEDADISPEAIEERTGGLGILMVKNMMDDVSYEYEDGKNIFTIQKSLEE